MLPLSDSTPTSRTPVLTLLLIALNLVVFAFVQPHGERQMEWQIEHAAIPCEVRERVPITVTEFITNECGVRAVPFPGSRLALREEAPFPNKQVYLAVIASMFLHGSWAHLLFNMLFLWIFGNNVEDRLGPVLFAAFYLITGLVAFGAHFAADPGSTTPIVGASGAIAGLMGAYLVFWPHARITTLVTFVVVSIPAWVVLVGWLVMQFFTAPGSQVAWVAHVGGFVSGALFAMMLPSTRRRRLDFT